MATPVHANATGTTWSSNTIQVLVCTSVSFYNSFELLVLILTTFKEWKWRSLYFDSMLIAAFGIMPYNIGLLLEYFHSAPFSVAMSFSSVGWIMLITGQSLVLYSRLNLVFTQDNRSRWILKAVKWMIIIDALIFHIAITIIQFGTKYGSHQGQFHKAIFYGERAQMTAFCIQEFIISGLYLWKTMELLKVISKRETRRTITGLFIINVLIILMDIGLLVLEYSNMYIPERAWKSFVYSVKLKLEFMILGRLVDLVQSNNRNLSATIGDVSSFALTDSIATDATRYPSIHRAILPSTEAPGTSTKVWAQTDGRESAQHIENANAV